MKNPSATSTIIVAVILLSALSTGGQQQSEKGQKQTPGFIPAIPKRKASAKPSDWRMPDGRIVEFPSSTSKEEIDELAKRIALGAVELLPGARVIGWEPVEGPFLYEEAIATIPTVKGKLDALANAVSILRSQINALQVQLESERAANNAGFRSTDKTLNNHADSFDALAAQVAYLAQQEQMRKPQPDVDDLKRELDKFKEVACPILRTANVSWNAKMNLDSACGLH